MTDTAGISRTWRVGKRYRCTLTLPATLTGFASCEWEPCMPERMTHREERDYIRGRDEAIKSITRELGVRPAK